MLEKSIKQLNRVSIRVRVSISYRISFRVSIRLSATVGEARAAFSHTPHKHAVTLSGRGL